MWFSRFWARVSPFARLQQSKTPRGICSVEQFRTILEREQARADRGGHQFSVVVFDVGNPEADSAQVQHLAYVLTNRIRLTDEAGWFDGHRIGVLLPHTSPAGAWRLADDVCQMIAAKASPPEWTVYTYPRRWYSDGNEHLRQLHFADLSPEWKTTTPRGFSMSVKYADDPNTDFATQQPLANTTPNCRSSARALEPFFIQPLPVWKRSMDILGALFGLVVLSPPLLIVALIIKTVSPGPAIYKQERTSRMGKVFAMLKFRTMKVNADLSAHKQHVTELIKGATHNNPDSKKPMTKLDGDPQIIPFGRMLRKTCLDELPQLINVLWGEMSLVGPRPPIPYEVKEYPQWCYGRFNAIPGMTGLWQVSGKNRLTFDEMVRLDIRYSREKSLWLDTKIILKTPLAIVSQIKDSIRNRKTAEKRR